MIDYAEECEEVIDYAEESNEPIEDSNEESNESSVNAIQSPAINKATITTMIETIIEDD